MGGETGTIRVGGAHAYVYFVGFWVRNPTYSTHVPMGSGYESWFIPILDGPYSVTDKSMKFNVELSNWAWCSTAGYPACKGKDGVGESVELDISVTPDGRFRASNRLW